MPKKRHPYELETRDLIDRLFRAGFPIIGVDNGEEFTLTSDKKKLLDEAIACDESKLYFCHPHGTQRHGMADHRTLWVFLVLGNAPGELVCDYALPPGDDQDAGISKVFDNFSDAWEDGGSAYFADRADKLENLLSRTLATAPSAPSAAFDDLLAEIAQAIN